MSLECGECERDARVGHAVGCSRGITFTRGEMARAIKQGADRERRRIRRALMPLLTEARKFCPPHDCGCINCEITKALDAATRAMKGKRK